MGFVTKTLTVLAVCVMTSAYIGLAPAQAGELFNGWNYTIDSFDDGADGNQRGAESSYEIYGMALKETADQVYIAINSNLNLGGQYAEGAEDEYIHYGDLFLNLSGADLGDAQGNLFAIQFDAGNDSGVNQVGVYGDVIGTNTAAENSGFDQMTAHRDWANEEYEANGAKVKWTASMGDLSYTEYFQQGRHTVSSSIQSGDYLGGITFLNEQQLADAGLNFGAVNSGVAGRHTIGFNFDRSLLPEGDYIAHVFTECINDGLAMLGQLPPVQVPDTDDEVVVPEPSLLMGIVLIGGLGLAKRRMTTV